MQLINKKYFSGRKAKSHREQALLVKPNYLEKITNEIHEIFLDNVTRIIILSRINRMMSMM